MARVLVVLLVGVSVLGSTLVDPEDAFLSLQGQLEHTALDHTTLLASGESQGHEHGDPDDRHDSPDSPCHHIAVHCCCSDNQVMASLNLGGLGLDGLCLSIDLPSVSYPLPIFPAPLFHVPLA